MYVSHRSNNWLPNYFKPSTIALQLSLPPVLPLDRTIRFISCTEASVAFWLCQNKEWSDVTFINWKHIGQCPTNNPWNTHSQHKIFYSFLHSPLALQSLIRRPPGSNTVLCPFHLVFRDNLQHRWTERHNSAANNRHIISSNFSIVHIYFISN